MNILLTKSRYMNGLQCLKLLWVAVNDRGRLPLVDAATQSKFDEGHQVGDLARRLYPGGIDLPADNFMGNIRLTRESLALRRPLFEAGFLCGKLYCRVDILNPSGGDGWDIIEVKATNSVKNEEHLPDVAFQRHVCKLAGIEVNRCFVMHINKDFVKDGDIEPADFFTLEDVTDLLPEYEGGIEERIDAMLSCLCDTEPVAEIGKRCAEPRECALQSECWAEMPEHHVMTLYWGGSLGDSLLRRGILGIADIPADVRLNGKQQIQRGCVVTGKTHCDRDEIRGFVEQLKYPLHFLDFETFRTAVPLYDGTRPYQQIMFQFSLDVCRGEGSALEHYGYLADGTGDPRPGVLRALKEPIGLEGTILAYNKSFEEGRLQEAARAFPGERPWIEGALARMTDLMAPFRGFLYYHPAQLGSFSLKKVLPALTGMGYDGMDIGDGNTASLKYLEAVFGGLDEAARQKIRADLETYCGQDTGGMAAVLAKLRELAA